MSLSRRDMLRAAMAFGVAAGDPPKADAAASAYTARIWIQAGQVLRTLPRELFGTTTEWSDNASGLWDPSIDDFHPQVLRLTQELAPGIIRYPGGTLADFYHWRDGVGPRAERPVVKSLPDGGAFAPLFGTDEAIAFAELTNSQLIITANCGDGTAEEAAAWVKYVNGNQPGRVKFWEVGNELYNAGGFDAILITIPPDVYAKRYLDYTARMKAEDPSILVGAIGCENYGSYILNSYPGWNNILMAEAGEELDYLCVHNAYAPVNFADDHLDVRTVYTGLLAAPAAIRRNLKTLGTQIGNNLPARSKEVKLAVTEWGPLFEFDPTPYVLHVRTLGSAVYMASVLKQIIDSPRTIMSCTFDLISDGFIGSIGLRDGNYIPNSQYLVLQLFTKHFGTRHIVSYYQCPTFNSQKVGIVDGEEGVPYIDVVTSLNDDGSMMYVMVINKHFDVPVKATIQIDGFQPARTGTAWVLTGTGIDANTGTDRGAWGEQAQDAINPRFNLGDPTEVTVTPYAFSGFRSSFTYTFPKLSVTALEIPRA